jgi:radical SAM superfamily enzyme YgiQ (UPF0313 family)
MADWVCFGEAETIMGELVADLRADRRGRQYDGGNQTNMEQVRIPRFDLLEDLNAYEAMAVQFSRGCPFRCEFCDIIEIYGRVARTKTPRQVLAELSFLDRLGFYGYVFLVDDNFIGNRRHARELLHELAIWNDEHGYPFKYYTEASINLADDEPLLEAMSKAVMVLVFIGIETPDRTLLKNMLKMQNVPGDLLAKLQRIRSHGIHIMAGFIVGFDGEDRGIFETQRMFVQASGIGVAMLGLLEAVPHTQLSRRLKQEGRLLERIASHVNTTLGGLNFVPKGSMTKRVYLEEYVKLVSAVYDPRTFFERIKPALLTLRAKVPLRASISNARQDVPAFFRILYHIGIKSRGCSSYFWRGMITVLWHNPSAFEAFFYDCYSFYYIRQHVAYIQRELANALATSPSDDSLDLVIPAFEPAATAVPAAV